MKSTRERFGVELGLLGKRTMTNDANLCEYKRGREPEKEREREKAQRAIYSTDQEGCIYPPSVGLLMHTWKSTPR